MKKTLLALLAMTACAMGDTLTFSTAPEYNGSEGGSYAGIVFTLGANDPERFALTGEIATPMVDLVSISLTERGSNNLADDRILYVTDSNNVYLGSSSVFTKAEGSDVAVFDFGGTITLNVADTYYAYLLTSAGDDSWTVGETVVPSGQFFSGQLAAAGGSLTAGNAANWGLLNGQKSLASTGYAPVMSIEVIPEPATATLSLLALAGLAARRRRASH